MPNKYHIAATGKNAGQYVPCDAKVNCRIGGEHLSKEQAEIKNIILSSELLMSDNKNEAEIEEDFSNIGFTGDISKFSPKPIITEDAKKIRDGLFLAASRTYGESYIEPIIRKIFGYSKPENADFDALNLANNEKYEIKSTKVLVAKEKTKTNNLFEDITNEVDQDSLSRIVSFKNRKNEKYGANIQNVKRDHFDSLIYILLYEEGIEIFRVDANSINKTNIKNWSDKHGRYDALGKSGQFNVNRDIIEYHEKQYFERFISYEDIVRVAKTI